MSQAVLSGAALETVYGCGIALVHRARYGDMWSFWDAIPTYPDEIRVDGIEPHVVRKRERPSWGDRQMAGNSESAQTNHRNRSRQGGEGAIVGASVPGRGASALGAARR